MTSLPERDRLLAELEMLTTVQGMLKYCKTVEQALASIERAKQNRKRRITRLEQLRPSTELRATDSERDQNSDQRRMP